ncbi:MAG TPA: NUDIX domain-containing protein [Patescibacteria group bacterium]|nr:NUDIX domain-containing protein [Patescibacteria group bacterium]
MKTNLVLISGAVVFRRLKNGKELWLCVKLSKDSDWEMPKVLVRKGESSVRAAIRYMAESGGMNAKVLEEVGRMGGSTVVGGKVIPRRYIYYLMMERSPGENLSIDEMVWHDLKKTQKMLALKKEKEMLKQASKVLKEWRKKRAQKSINNRVKTK